MKVNCGCASRRAKMLNYIRRWFPARVEKVAPQGDINDPRIKELLKILNKFDLHSDGPDGKDIVDKQTLIYQSTVTWIIDYDAKTMKCMQAKRREDDFRV